MPVRYDSFDHQVGLTNAHLSEHEAKFTKARLQARQLQLFQVTQAIRLNAPEMNRTQLIHDLSMLNTLISRYHIALAPYKRLPREMLQHIFHYVPLGSDLSGPSLHNAPLLLGRICSAWRRTVLRMPELWKDLHFFVENAHTQSQKVNAALMWFSRAGDLPLSLTITDTSEIPAPKEDFVTKVIVPFSHQFKYLHLVLQSSQIRALLSLPVGSLDSLQELHVVAHTGPPWTSPISVFSPQARLRRIRIQLTPLVVPQTFTLPWDRLDTFRCDSSLQSDDCHQLLLSCQSLGKLHIRVFGIRHSGPSAVQIPLPNLRSLTVQLCDAESYDSFFLPLILPTLRSLVIYNYDGIPWSPRMYSSLLERSRCQIEELYLGTLDAQSRDVLALLQLTPSLKSITFSHNTLIDTDVWHRVGDCSIGGRLEEIFLKGARNLDPILNLLETRETIVIGGRQLTSPLKFIETFCDPEEIVTHWTRIERLRNSGIQISLLQTQEDHFHL
jgi:F-box-like